MSALGDRPVWVNVDEAPGGEVLSIRVFPEYAERFYELMQPAFGVAMERGDVAARRVLLAAGSFSQRHAGRGFAGVSREGGAPGWSRVYTTAEASEVLGVSEQWVRKLRRPGRALDGCALPRGRSFIWDAAAVDALARELGRSISSRPSEEPARFGSSGPVGGSASSQCLSEGGGVGGSVSFDSGDAGEGEAR